MKKTQKLFKNFTHLFYASGIMYALYFWATTPKSKDMFQRRLWAYECWLIFTLYGILLWLFYITNENEARKSESKIIRFLRKRRIIQRLFPFIVVLTIYTVKVTT